MKGLIGIAKASEILGVSKNTLYRYVKKQQIPFVRFNHRVFFVEEKLREFIEKHSFEPEVT